MLWQNYKLFLNKRCIMEENTQFDIPAKAYLVGKYFNIILAINLKKGVKDNGEILPHFIQRL